MIVLPAEHSETLEFKPGQYELEQDTWLLWYWTQICDRKL